MIADDERRADVPHRAELARDRASEMQRAIDVSINGRHDCQLGREINAAGVRAQTELLAEQLVAARERIAHLEIALQTNRHIAMAIGILMARRGLTEDQAFAQLRTVSQRRHLKLRDVAEEVVLTGDVH